MVGTNVLVLSIDRGVCPVARDCRVGLVLIAEKDARTAPRASNICACLGSRNTLATFLVSKTDIVARTCIRVLRTLVTPRERMNVSTGPRAIMSARVRMGTLGDIAKNKCTCAITTTPVSEKQRVSNIRWKRTDFRVVVHSVGWAGNANINHRSATLARATCIVAVEVSAENVIRERRVIARWDITVYTAWRR